MRFKTIKLGEIAHTASGGTPARGHKLYYGGDIPWIKSGELPDGEITRAEETITKLGLEQSAAKIFDKGTLLIAMYGATVGKLGILGFPAATNQAVCAIVPDSRFESRFLYFWLLYIRKSLIESSFGGAQPNISQSTVRNIDVPLLPKDVQIQIANKLASAFSEIDAAQKAATMQLREITNLSSSLVTKSGSNVTSRHLGDVLEEVKTGIGPTWKKFPVLGATSVVSHKRLELFFAVTDGRSREFSNDCGRNITPFIWETLH